MIQTINHSLECFAKFITPQQFKKHLNHQTPRHDGATDEIQTTSLWR